MDKLYIMLSNGIVGMGGGQMYTKNKAVYMKSLGYDVQIYSGHQGIVLIKDLMEYQKYIDPIFLSSPLVYKKSTVNRITQGVKDKASNYKEIIIESGIAHMALWGEIFAKELNCKHMVHLLDERNDLLVPESYLDFYWFKHSRRELSGITANSLKMLFRNNVNINDSNSYWLPSYCQNVVSEEQSGQYEEFPIADYNLCTIGRLDKPYVLEAAKAYVRLANKRKDICWNFIFIGGADENKTAEIKSAFEGIENAHAVMLGYVYPIPNSLLNRMDLFISSAGSAGVSYSADKRTITIDSVDLKAIGVLGYTTFKRLNRDDEPKVEIDELIEKVLFTDYLTHFSYKENIKVDGEKLLRQHIDFMEASTQKKEYYPVWNLQSQGKEKVKKIIATIIGDKLYIKLNSKRACNAG